ncbi:MAG: hypothetical protein U0821_00390 [Chloroflexota bacterium]
MGSEATGVSVVGRRTFLAGLAGVVGVAAAAFGLAPEMALAKRKGSLSNSRRKKGKVHDKKKGKKSEKKRG